MYWLLLRKSVTVRLFYVTLITNIQKNRGFVKNYTVSPPGGITVFLLECGIIVCGDAMLWCLCWMQ